MDRVCDDASGTSVLHPGECTERCKDYKFMGLACPHTSDDNERMECWCCNTLDRTNADTDGKLDDDNERMECWCCKTLDRTNAGVAIHLIGPMLVLQYT